MAISHFKDAGITNVLFISQSAKQSLYLRDTVVKLASVATHPALIPALFCGFRTDVLTQKREEGWRDLFDIEVKGGQNALRYPTVLRGDPNNPALTLAAIKANQHAIYFENRIICSERVVKPLIDFVKQQLGHGDLRRSPNNPIAAVRAKQNTVVQERLGLVQVNIEFFVVSMQHLRARTELQITAVCFSLVSFSNKVTLR